MTERRAVPALRKMGPADATSKLLHPAAPELRTTKIWTAGPDDAPLPTRTPDAVWLSGKGLDPAATASSSSTPPGPESIMLLPTEPSRGACGVALVPDAVMGTVLLNGVRLGAGMHVLRHADRVAVSGQGVWFAVVAEADEVVYDPEVHGDPAYCLRTKTRLKAGDAMVICRGTPEADCGMRFTAAAWSTGIPCHSCGALPGAPGWVPPVSERSGSLVELLELVREA